MKNTVTQEQIDALLDNALTEEAVFWGKELNVSYKLPSGFTVTGRAAVVDPANFDIEIGRRYARQDAASQLWRLEGYLLQNKLHIEKLREKCSLRVMGDEVAVIAKMCHQVKKAWCDVNGDHSQVNYWLAEGWQIDSAMRGVRFALENPDATPEDQHNKWMADKIADGWVYGLVKDADAKTHPCLVPYQELPLFQRKKDELFRAIVKVLAS